LRPTNKIKKLYRRRPVEKRRQELVKGLAKMVKANEDLTKIYDDLLVKSKQIGKNSLRDKRTITLLEEKVKKFAIDKEVDVIKVRKQKLVNSKLQEEVIILKRHKKELTKEVERISEIGYNIHAKVEEIQDREIERLHILVDKLEAEITEVISERDRSLDLLNNRNVAINREHKKAEALWDLFFQEKENG